MIYLDLKFANNLRGIIVHTGNKPVLFSKQ